MRNRRCDSQVRFAPTVVTLPPRRSSRLSLGVALLVAFDLPETAVS